MGDVMNGNRALFKMGGRSIGAGLVQNVTVADDYGMQRVSGIGRAEAVELVEGEFVHTINISTFFFYNKSLVDRGFVPDADDIFNSLPFDIEIQDRVSKRTVAHYTGCKITSCNRTFGKHVISGQDATIFAIHREQ